MTQFAVGEFVIVDCTAFSLTYHRFGQVVMMVVEIIPNDYPGAAFRYRLAHSDEWARKFGESGLWVVEERHPSLRHGRALPLLAVNRTWTHAERTLVARRP